MSLSERLRRSFVAGLILLAPLVVTVYVIRTLANWTLQLVEPIVASTRLASYTGDDQLLAQFVAIGAVLVAVVVLGSLAQRNAGRQLFGNVGRIVNVVPLVNTIYTSVRQVANSLVDRDEAYESVVLVEYPRDGIYSIGLVTGDSPVDVDAFGGESVYNVYFPNSPNPTGGRLALVPESDLHETDMSVKAGLRLLVTTGVTEDGEPKSVPAVSGETVATRDETPDHR
ncbi:MULTISPECIES: DUF502 domain-containing protein [Halomicrobium]|uniref:DUF502 domain-containing protein n=2 Tax=Halomicrobium mukohataei TaxID=57705 RepID=C7P2P4_HALMD|nr:MULTISPECIES: DUF502 domain-containing protein [Halomicrobium]ACV47366.1 protein of unknown function DUF502 [Halomicrobium mukohataei DSM 12286]QCD65833.1 DUF502 domain-containing protein [Halomicrobium mukohataei]QFR20638.1 DUF502 domain-containing protein [Halomicrobium sp. ZPS1]